MITQEQTTEEVFEEADDSWGLRTYEDSNKRFAQVPEGLWTYEVTKIGKPTLVKDEYQNPEKNKHQSTIEFTVTDTAEVDEDDLPIAGRTVRMFFPLSMNSDSKFMQIVAVPILGEVDPKRKYGPDDFRGGKLQGLTKLGKKKTNKTGQDVRYPYIESSMAITKPRARKAQV